MQALCLPEARGDRGHLQGLLRMGAAGGEHGRESEGEHGVEEPAGGEAAGHEHLYNRVREEADRLPNVEHLGFVPFSEIDSQYARASVYLCTSTIEGFPNTFLQAWNHKTPVVSTYNPDGMLNSGDVGVSGDDIETLVHGIARLCGKEGRHMGDRARQHLERVHSVDAVLPKLEAVLMGGGT